MHATCPQATAAYQRHQPEDSLLYSVLAENLETFLQVSMDTQIPAPRIMRYPLVLSASCAPIWSAACRPTALCVCAVQTAGRAG